jgi:tetratricopeptide (TPR) repeat protein
VIAVLKKGILYKQVENWDKALEFYNEAIKIEPNFAPAYREKAELLKSAQRFSQAVEAYESYLKLNNSCSASQRYATFLFLAKDFTKAMAELERTLPCNPNNAVMYRVLAYTCLETGDYAKGLENIDAFFSKVQDSKYLTGADYAVKGKLLNALGQDSLGVAMITKGMELDTAYKSGYDEIIELYKKAKKFDKVAMWSEKKIKRLGGKPLDYFNWAQNLYLSKNYMRADSVFATVEEQYFEATLMRAKANNRMEVADNFKGLGKPHFEKYITRIVDAETNIPGTIEKSKKGLAEAYDYLGVFYARNNDDGCAKAAWSIVLTMDGAHKRANEMLAEKEMQAADGTLCTLLPSLTPKKKEEVAPQEAPKE